MSSHIYRKTTVEYYEFLMSDTHETMFWPLSAAENYLVVSEYNRYHNPCMVEWYHRPTIYEFRAHSIPNSEDEQEQDQAEEFYQEFDHQPESEEPSTSTATPTNEKGKKNRVYRAKEGYLVEEPTSESSEEDKENAS